MISNRNGAYQNCAVNHRRSLALQRRQHRPSWGSERPASLVAWTFISPFLRNSPTRPGERPSGELGLAGGGRRFHSIVSVGGDGCCALIESDPGVGEELGYMPINDVTTSTIIKMVPPRLSPKRRQEHEKRCPLHPAHCGTGSLQFRKRMGPKYQGPKGRRGALGQTGGRGPARGRGPYRIRCQHSVQREF